MKTGLVVDMERFEENTRDANYMIEHLILGENGVIGSGTSFWKLSKITAVRAERIRKVILENTRKENPDCRFIAIVAFIPIEPE